MNCFCELWSIGRSNNYRIQWDWSDFIIRHCHKLYLHGYANETMMMGTTNCHEAARNGRGRRILFVSTMEIISYTSIILYSYLSEASCTSWSLTSHSNWSFLPSSQKNGCSSYVHAYSKLIAIKYHNYLAIPSKISVFCETHTDTHTSTTTE